MNNIKPGYKTTEFWVTAVVNIATAVVGILALRGLLSDQESTLYVDLARALVSAIAPIVIGVVTTAYTKSRTAVKLTH